MTEATYSIDRDLSEAKALAEHLIPYIYEKELYGSISGMFGSGAMPSLTIGALLLRLHRLHALESLMSAAQKVLLAEIDASHDAARKEWTVHYNDKLVQEANSRLRQMDHFFGECSESPRNCANNYPPEALRRTVVADIQRALQSGGATSADLERAVQKSDTQLRRFAQPSDFIWASALQPAYPQGEYWWLYARPPRAATK